MDIHMAPFDFKKFLEGKKTYIMTVAILCYALGGWVSGYVEPTTAITLILGALGLGSLRAAIAKMLGIKPEVIPHPSPGVSI